MSQVHNEKFVPSLRLKLPSGVSFDTAMQNKQELEILYNVKVMLYYW